MCKKVKMNTELTNYTTPCLHKTTNWVNFWFNSKSNNDINSRYLDNIHLKTLKAHMILSSNCGVDTKSELATST